MFRLKFAPALVSLVLNTPSIDGLYAIGDMGFDDPAKAHKIYQLHYNKIF